MWLRVGVEGLGWGWCRGLGLSVRVEGWYRGLVSRVSIEG